MTDAQKLIAQVFKAHPERWAMGCNGCEWLASDTESYADHLAAEIDKALGGLARQWAVRYTDGGVTTRPSPGQPPAGAERVGELFARTGREIVVGWASGWTGWTEADHA